MFLRERIRTKLEPVEPLRYCRHATIVMVA